MTARLYCGRVWHGRRAPARHQFAYRHGWVAVSLPEQDVDTLRLAPGISWSRHRHGPRDGQPLWPWLTARLAEHGLDKVGRIELHTLPAVLGYVFNPVSFYLVLDDASQLRAVWVEVSNTFGDHHDYCVHHPGFAPIGPRDRLELPKRLHVSPFFRVEGRYGFCFDYVANGRFKVRIDYRRDGEHTDFVASQQGWPQPLTASRLWRQVLGCAGLTFAVWLRIHWQALRLWRRAVPFFGKQGEVTTPPVVIDRRLS